MTSSISHMHAQTRLHELQIAMSSLRWKSGYQL